MFLLMRRHVKARYQLIHVHSVPDFLVFAAWFPKLTGAKIILDIHDLLPELYAGKYGTDHNSVSVQSAPPGGTSVCHVRGPCHRRE